MSSHTNPKPAEGARDDGEKQGAGSDGPVTTGAKVSGVSAEDPAEGADDSPGAGSARG